MSAKETFSSAIQPNSLLDVCWLDYGTRCIDWSIWDFDGTEKASIGTGSAIADKAIYLIALIAESISNSGSYIGGVELQLLTHSLIYERRKCEAAGDFTTPRIIYIALAGLGSVYSCMDRGMSIIVEICARYLDANSPIIGDRFLSYPPGKVMGVDEQTPICI